MSAAKAETTLLDTCNFIFWFPITRPDILAHLKIKEKPAQVDKGSKPVSSNLNCRYITPDRFGDEGTSMDLNARIMLVLE